VAATASAIAPTDLTSPLLLVQWVDLSTRRRAEQARAELLLEQAARGHAEAEAARLQKLQRLVEAVESRSVRELTAELARRLAEVFEADAAEIELDCGTERRSATFRAGGVERSPPAEGAGGACEQALLTANRTEIGVIRLSLAPGQTLDASDRALLRDAAEQISLLVRRMQLHEQEHRIAVELQRGLLPARLPELPGVAVAAHYEAAGLGAEVGGDWYDAFLLPGDRLGVVIGDVTGSGIQAASAMVQLRSVTRAFALGDPDPPSPAEVLTRLHRYSQKLGFEDLFTVVYLILDPGEETVTWANAGHPPPMQRTAGGEVRMLAAGESMMVDADIAYRDHQASVTDGDTLILYTDGLIERRGETIDAGLERLATAVRTGPPGADALCEHIVTANPASGAPLHDDVTALVLALTPLMVDVAAANGRDASADRVEVVLPPDSHAPADARALLEKSFGHALERGELERAKLAVSELATNAVRHGRGEITIRAELGRERLLVEVIDEGPGFEPIVHEPELEQLGGWGLNIVDVDTSRWGMREGTTHVWFEIERGARPPSVVSRITSPGFCG
jgi:serine phosphatase RsbU (regulator of sigma subunit)/anti-sigma regulatory factor (Ser/Thr protein kinase)